MIYSKKLAETCKAVFINMGTGDSPLDFMEISCGYLSVLGNSLNICELINQRRSQNLETLAP